MDENVPGSGSMGQNVAGMADKQATGGKGMSGRVAILFVIVVIAAAAFFYFSYSRPVATTSTTVFTTAPITRLSTLAAANISMVNATMMSQTYPGISLSQFTYSSGSGLNPGSRCARATGALNSNVTEFTIPLNATSIYNSPGFDKNTPLEVYSNYFSFGSGNINIQAVTLNCSYGRYLFNKTYVLNATISNVSGKMGVASLLYKFTGFTQAGLNLSGGTYNIAPSNVSFYVLRFVYKNFLITGGVLGFTNHINETRLFSLAKLIQSNLVQNGV